MVDLTSYKKADLIDVARKLDLAVNTKDTKKLLIEKLEAYISEAGPEGEALIEASLEVEEQEDDDDDDEETLAEKDEIVEVDEEDEDKEYKGPPIDVLKFFDPVIDYFEQYYSKLLDFTDSVGITTLEYNEELRENLSKTITLNYIEIAFEIAYFFYMYVPLVAVKDNSSIHPLLRENIPILSKCSLPLPDLTYLINFKILSITFNWALAAIVIPLGLSYYFNFTRRSLIIDDDTSVMLRIYKYDPFIFALSKVIIFYFIVYSSNNLITLNSYSNIFKALETQVLIHLGFIKEFNSLLGNFPLVLGIANVVIGLYAQFEDF